MSAYDIGSLIQTFYDNGFYYPNTFLVIMFGIFAFCCVLTGIGILSIFKIIQKNRKKIKALLDQFQRHCFRKKTYNSLYENRQFITLFLSLFTSLAIYILLSLFVNNFYHPDIQHIVNNASLLSIRDKSMFFPEPTERLLYMLGIVTIPLFLFIFTYIYQKFVKKIRKISNFAYALLTFLALVPTSILIAEGLKNAKYYYLQYEFIYNFPLLAAFATLVIVASLCFTYTKNIYRIYRMITKLLYLGLTFFVTLATIIPRIFSYHDFYNHVPNHLETIFYSIPQVFYGKPLLVNGYANLYGLYPFFLEPVFRFFGLTILNMTMVMSVLGGVCVLAVSFFLYTFLRSKLLSLLGLLTFFSIYVMDGSLPFQASMKGPYFQYFPTRVLFPTLFITLASIYFRKKNRLMYVLIHFIASISVLWNLDSGVVVFGAWVISLLWNELSEAKVFQMALKKCVLHILIAALSLGIVISSYCAITYIRYHAFPDFHLFVQYQNYYYILGFIMVPMKLIHPWNILMLTYVIAVAYACIQFWKKENSYRSTLYIVLAVVGMGSFARFQGRSTVTDLWGPMYSFLILIPVLADELLYKIRFHHIYTVHIVVPFIALCFVLTSGVGYIATYGLSIPVAISKQIRTLALETKPHNSMVSKEVDFITAHSQPGEDIIILTTFPSLYYTESGRKSALKTPGLMELFLKADVASIMQQLATNRNTKVFVGRIVHIGEYEFWTPEMEKLIEDRYMLVDKSDIGTMELYEPKNP